MMRYSLSYLYYDKYDGFVQICRITDQLERKRPGGITVEDVGGLGCLQCTGQVWGSKVCGEPFDESWRSLIGPDC